MDVDLGGHLADARVAALGEDLQDTDGAVDGLHPAHRVTRCLVICGVVAHDATIGMGCVGSQGVVREGSDARIPAHPTPSAAGMVARPHRRRKTTVRFPSCPRVIRTRSATPPPVENLADAHAAHRTHTRGDRR
ncbi:hypothetical protein GCM10018780_84750 [Streptomyces lanatus]|nr:hypothetical protein GCM10018780_84750 [Streptomyces lanatus]